MHTHSTTPWRHDHTFGQDRPRGGERRTLLVLALTAATMVVEIAAGLAFGSVALLADGLHMGSHATALGIAAFAYVSGCETSLAASAMRRASAMSAGPARPCGLGLASLRRALRRSATT